MSSQDVCRRDEGGAGVHSVQGTGGREVRLRGGYKRNVMLKEERR